MTAQARAEVLSRIARALGPVRGETEVPRQYRRAEGDAAAPQNSRAQLVDLLTDRLIDYRATVRSVSATDLAGAIASSAQRRSLRRVAVPDGFPVHWLSEVDAERLRADGLSVAELDSCDGTFSTCAIAIAETGTIVLDAGPGQGPRAVSLVPDYLLIVVRFSQIVARVPDAVAAIGRDAIRPLTWISGPSATSDIELKRVEGVHGPRTLDVVLVDDEAPAP